MSSIRNVPTFPFGFRLLSMINFSASSFVFPVTSSSLTFPSCAGSTFAGSSLENFFVGSTTFVYLTSHCPSSV